MIDSTANTTTDFGGGTDSNPLSVLLQSVNAAGLTASGCAKVLCEVIPEANQAAARRELNFKSFRPFSVRTSGLV